MIIIEMILLGVFATIFMDLFAGFLLKRQYIHMCLITKHPNHGLPFDDVNGIDDSHNFIMGSSNQI